MSNQENITPTKLAEIQGISLRMETSCNFNNVFTPITNRQALRQPAAPMKSKLHKIKRNSSHDSPSKARRVLTFGEEMPVANEKRVLFTPVRPIPNIGLQAVRSKRHNFRSVDRSSVIKARRALNFDSCMEQSETNNENNQSNLLAVPLSSDDEIERPLYDVILLNHKINAVSVETNNKTSQSSMRQYFPICAKPKQLSNNKSKKHPLRSGNNSIIAEKH